MVIAWQKIIRTFVIFIKCNDVKENVFVCMYTKSEIFGTSIEEGPDGNPIIGGHRVITLHICCG